LWTIESKKDKEMGTPILISADASMTTQSVLMAYWFSLPHRSLLEKKDVVSKATASGPQSISEDLIILTFEIAI